MKKIFVGIMVLALGLILVACGGNQAPVIEGAKDLEIAVGAAFDPLAGITASDKEDGNLTESIQVEGEVDVNTPGSYTVKYIVSDSKGKTHEISITVVVKAEEILEGYAQHTNFSLKFADTDTKAAFFAAAENYMIENVIGGVPMYTAASRTIFSDRIQLFSETHNSIMGFGVAFSKMNKDDTHVKMDNGQPGNANEYTYRSWIQTEPSTLNHWIYDDEASSDILGYVLDGLYRFVWNADKTGYAVEPSMASDVPQPVEPQQIGEKTASRTWRVPIRDGLKWYFHDDLTEIPEGWATDIKAKDFVDTYKFAMENKMFRAISGGGDFIKQGIVKASDFVAGRADWDEVGIKVVGENEDQIEFKFNELMTEWEIKYWLSGFVTTPIHFGLYDSLKNAQGNSTYGTKAERIAYTGPYKISEWEDGKVIRLVRNEDWHTRPHNEGLYHYTGYSFVKLADANIAMQEFELGKLDSVGVPTTFIDKYKDDARVKIAPDAATQRLVINGLGTVENLKKVFPESDYVPEPILGYLEMRQALMWGLNRKALAEAQKTVTPAVHYFSTAYMLDAESGIAVRETEQSKAFDSNYSLENAGYSPDAAKILFKEAVAKAIADGHYKKGTAAAPTIIKLEVTTHAIEATAFFLKSLIQEYNKLLVDDENHVKVVLEAKYVEFPNSYYDFFMPGKYQLGTGGISGSTLDAPGFLDVFADDNRGGFTLDWGADTSTANITVKYKLDGEEVEEIWSFNAIVSAFSGTVNVRNGIVYSSDLGKAEEDRDSIVAPTPVVNEKGVQLALPKAGTHNKSEITWVSDNPEYIDNTGEVLKVPATGNVTVKLTATIKLGEATTTAVFEVVLTQPFKLTLPEGASASVVTTVDGEEELTPIKDLTKVLVGKVRVTLPVAENQVIYKLTDSGVDVTSQVNGNDYTFDISSDVEIELVLRNLNVYTVKYQFEGGALFTYAEVLEGGKAESLALPRDLVALVAPDKVQDGWKVSGGSKFDFNTVVYKDLVLEPNFVDPAADDVIVRFNSFDGTFVPLQVLPNDTELRFVELLKPSLPGFTFVGWYLDEALTQPLVTSENLDKTLDELFSSEAEVELFAKYGEAAKIEFFELVEDEENKPQIYAGKTIYSAIGVNTNVLTLFAPQAKGKIFKGWYTDDKLTTEFAHHELTKDIKLYAKFADAWDVTFDLDGGLIGPRTEVVVKLEIVLDADEKEIPVEIGANLPAAPVKPGYIFTGWVLGIEEFDAGSEVSSDLIVKATYRSLVHKVYFEGEDLGRVVLREVDDGQLVELPNPLPIVPEGKVLKFYNADDNQEFDFTTPITENLVIIVQLEDAAPVTP